MGPSIWQLLIIILVILLLFGAGRLPRVMEDMAKGIKSFKKGMEDEGEDHKKPEPKRALKHDRADDVIDAETADSTTETSAKDKE